MARLLRSYIQDFVQEVPVGQMAQGTPFQPACARGEGRGRLNLSTVSNTPPKGRRIPDIAIVLYFKCTSKQY